MFAIRSNVEDSNSFALAIRLTFASISAITGIITESCILSSFEKEWRRSDVNAMYWSN